METKKTKKNKKWTHLRHRIMNKILKLILGPYARWKYGFKYKKFKDTKNRPYLILTNHQTPFDQFFAGMSFSGTIYFVASEDLFSNGFPSRLIEYLAAPVPIKKSMNDIRAVMNCIKIVKEGYSVEIAIEGNRTFSGKTETIKPAIAKLAKMLKVPIAFYIFEGGYGVQPRWSDVIRKGKMYGHVCDVLEPEVYEKMSNEELYEYIKEKIYVDETKIKGKYYHEHNAEYLERVIYVCPECGLSEFVSKLDKLSCKKCGLTVRYDENKEFKLNGKPFKLLHVKEWYEYQEKFIHNLDLNKFNNFIYQDLITYSKVNLYKNKEIISENAKLNLYNNRIVVNYTNTQKEFMMDNIAAMSVLGRNKINLYVDDDIFQFKGDKRFNAVKYVNIYYHYKNSKLGDSNERTLGL